VVEQEKNEERGGEKISPIREKKKSWFLFYLKLIEN